MAEARRVADAMSDEIKQECTPIPFAARASRGVKLSPSPGLVAWKPRLAQNVSLRLGGFGAPSLHGSLARDVVDIAVRLGAALLAGGLMARHPGRSEFQRQSESRDPRHPDRHRLPWSRRDFQAGILQRRRTHHGCFAVVHGGAWDHLRTRILLSGGARHFRSAFHSCNVAVARMARDASMLRAANALLCQGPHHEPGRAGADLGGAGLYHSPGRLSANRGVGRCSNTRWSSAPSPSKTSRRWREPWLVCLTSLISTSRPPRNSAEPSKKAALLVIYRGPHDSCGVEA